MFKRKLVTPLVALLLCVGMISVGFAAWVITGNDSKTATGNFTVYTVNDNRYKFSVDSSTEANIVFGRPTSTSTNPWLTYDNTVAEEKLTATIVLKSGDSLSLNVGDVVAYTIEESGEIKESNSSSVYSTAKTAGYVGDLPKMQGEWKFTINNGNVEVTTPNSSSNVSATATFSEGVLTVTFTLQFNWGAVTAATVDSETVYQNPYTYFNALSDMNAAYSNSVSKVSITSSTTGIEATGDGTSITNADVAYGMLKTIAGLENAGYEVTIVGSVTRAAETTASE